MAILSDNTNQKEIRWSGSNTSAALLIDTRLTDELKEEKIVIPHNVQFYEDRLRECIAIVNKLVPENIQYTNEWAQLVAIVFARNTIPLSRLGFQRKKENSKGASRSYRKKSGCV